MCVIHIKSDKWDVMLPRIRQARAVADALNRRAPLHPPLSSTAVWALLNDWHGWRCCSCGHRYLLRPDRLTLRHRWPLAFGGAHLAGNLEPVCQHCLENGCYVPAQPKLHIPEHRYLLPAPRQLALAGD